MITQGVKTAARCDACGGVLERDIGQFIDRGRLWWGIEAGCRSCTAGWCERGSGRETPEEIRRALLAEHGAARLRLTGPGASSVTVLRALREVRDLTLAQTRALAEELRTTGLVGTLVEMELMAGRLRQRSVSAVVEPC